MKTVQNTFSELIRSMSDYQSVSTAISAALDVLMNENDQIDTSFIDYELYDEDRKRGLKSSDTLRGRRARHMIKSYILELVIASIREEIAKNDTFHIPGQHENDGIFDAAIVSRYEIEDSSNSKEELHDFAYFDTRLKGTLNDAFEAHGCQKIIFCIKFEANLFSDVFEITDIADVEETILTVEMLRDYNIPIENLEALANYLEANRNKQLLLHQIRYSK